MQKEKRRVTMGSDHAVYNKKKKKKKKKFTHKSSAYAREALHRWME